MHSITVITAEPPIADQRKRHPDDRRQSHHHHQVDRGVEEDARGQPRGGKLGEACPAVGR